MNSSKILDTPVQRTRHLSWSFFANSSNENLINEAHKLLGGALTEAEIRQLSHTKDLIQLPPDELVILINNIQLSRPEEKNSPRFLYSNENCFLNNLCSLLDSGITLSDFAKLSSYDQLVFLENRNFVSKLINNEVSFGTLSKLHYNGLFDLQFRIDPHYPHITSALYNTQLNVDERKQLVEKVRGHVNKSLEKIEQDIDKILYWNNNVISREELQQLLLAAPRNDLMLSMNIIKNIQCHRPGEEFGYDKFSNVNYFLDGYCFLLKSGAASTTCFSHASVENQRAFIEERYFVASLINYGIPAEKIFKLHHSDLFRLQSNLGHEIHLSLLHATHLEREKLIETIKNNFDVMLERSKNPTYMPR